MNNNLYYPVSFNDLPVAMKIQLIIERLTENRQVAFWDSYEINCVCPGCNIVSQNKHNSSDDFSDTENSWSKTSESDKCGCHGSPKINDGSDQEYDFEVNSDFEYDSELNGEDDYDSEVNAIFENDSESSVADDYDSELIAIFGKDSESNSDSDYAFEVEFESGDSSETLDASDLGMDYDSDYDNAKDYFNEFYYDLSIKPPPASLLPIPKWLDQTN